MAILGIYVKVQGCNQNLYGSYDKYCHNLQTWTSRTHRFSSSFTIDLQWIYVNTHQYLLEIIDYLEEPGHMLGFNGVIWCCCHEEWWLLWSLELDVAGDLRNDTRILNNKQTCVVWLFKVGILLMEEILHQLI